MSLLFKRSMTLHAIRGLCVNGRESNTEFAKRNYVQQQNHADYEINWETTLSKENLDMMLEKMKKAPGVGIKLRGRQAEQAFASVLIAICTDDEGRNPAILYTRRSRMLSRHMRQISFPGGIKEPNEDYIECALRETEEEIGLPSTRVSVLGATNLITPPHTAAIMPVVGFVHNFNADELTLNEAEVEEAFTVPIQDLAHPKSFHYTQFKSGYSSPVFIVGDKKIWGITGFLTNLFLNCLIPQESNHIRNRCKFIRPFKCDT